MGSHVPLLPGFDRKVYKDAGKRQNMRLFGCSKRNEKRYKRRVALVEVEQVGEGGGDRQWITLDTLQECEQRLGESLADYLIQNVAFETVILPPADNCIYYEDQPRPVSSTTHDADAREVKSTITSDQAQPVTSTRTVNVIAPCQATQSAQSSDHSRQETTSTDGTQARRTLVRYEHAPELYDRLLDMIKQELHSTGCLADNKNGNPQTNTPPVKDARAKDQGRRWWLRFMFACVETGVPKDKAQTWCQKSIHGQGPAHQEGFLKQWESDVAHLEQRWIKYYKGCPGVAMSRKMAKEDSGGRIYGAWSQRYDALVKEASDAKTQGPKPEQKALTNTAPCVDIITPKSTMEQQQSPGDKKSSIKAQLVHSDYGRAELFAELVRDIAKVAPDLETTAVYDEKKRLWDKRRKRSDGLEPLVAPTLLAQVNQCFHPGPKPNQSASDEIKQNWATKNEIYKTMRKLCGRRSTTVSTAKTAMTMLVDEQFDSLFDNHSRGLPVAEGQMVVYGRHTEQCTFATNNTTTASTAICGCAPGCVSTTCRDRRPDDYCTYQLPARYNGTPNNSSVTEVMHFLQCFTLHRHTRAKDLEKEICTEPDHKSEQSAPQYLEFLQVMFAKCIMHTIAEWKMIGSFVGTTGTGKSTLFALLKETFGPHLFCLVPLDKLLRKKGARTLSSNGEGPTPFLNRLAGVAFAVAPEIEAKMVWIESMVLALSGGEQLEGRKMHSDHVTPIRFNGMLFAYFNDSNEPEYANTPQSQGRHVRLPANCEFTKEPKEWYQRLENPKFRDGVTKKPDSLSAFLNWILEGCAKAHLPRFESRPYVEIISRHTKRAHAAMATELHQFIADRLVDTPGATVAGAEMQQACRAWVNRQIDLGACLSKRFADDLYKQVKLFVRHKSPQNKVTFLNYKLRSPPADAPANERAGQCVTSCQMRC